MAVLPAPRTWTVGELVTAAKLNNDVRDGINFLLSPPMAVLLPDGGQYANDTDTVVRWSSEALDRDGGHDNTTNNTRYTAQTAGWYDFDFSAFIFGGQSSGILFLGFTKNANVSWAAGSGFPLALNRLSGQLSTTLQMSVGDYIQAWVRHTTGGSKTLDSTGTRFAIRWVST
ncbi:hypothetical protein [Microtetraspora niveoalba]|uniref:hypothetical protein n=1 Tax=Microtetraspora niveoalba TaxID=46175 RepID=UPI000834549B|nr:hypothetical protein [Microtetraspora niveoalba]